MHKSDIIFVIKFCELNGYLLDYEDKENGNFVLKKNNISIQNYENQLRFEIGFSKEIK